MKKRIGAFLLVIALLLGCASFLSCDGNPDDVFIDGSQLIPNGDKAPSGSGESDEPNTNEGGIGNNEAVDLPYLPA